MIIWIEAIGLIAGFCGITATVPQIIKAIRTRHTRDLSTGLVFLMIVCTFLWLIYGGLISAYAIIITNSIAFLLWIIILFLKLKYK